ncbi:MAG: hypothetical protein JOZ69_00965, partial [Myxococcales bacterium]|nr:hypothetical protein [Myxococcales bacterium]
MRGYAVKAVVFVSCVAGLLVTACSTVFHLDDYSVEGSDVGALDGGDADLPPSTDAAADQCVGRACPGAGCVPFDNTVRIAGYSEEAGLPPLPDAGPPPVDAGASEGGGRGGGGGGGGGADASTAGLTPCSSLPQPVFVFGSNSLQSIAAELSALSSTVPITVVYVTAHSCDGPKSIIVGETATDTGDTTANYWDVSGTIHTCALDPGQNADIGMSSVFPEQCVPLPQGLPTNVGDFLGPVTPGVIVAPATSSQKAVSAEALYYIVGMGSGAVAPWTSLDYVFVSASSGGVQLDFSLAIGVPATRWFGNAVNNGATNVARIATSAQPEQTLGVMGTDLAETASTSSTIKELAFQDVGQTCAFYPNSTETSGDKRNVRNGNYAIWGFTHMFSKVNAQGVPLNPNAATIINYFTGGQPTPTGNFLKFIINDYLVP